MQFIFESVFASMLEQNQARRAIAVIYTPYPPTPLRTDGTNVEGLVAKDAASDPERLNTVLTRHESLNNYLSQGGVLYAMHRRLITGDEKALGSIAYQKHLNQYPQNLLDKPIDNFNDQYIGASYLIECQSGEQIFVAISGRQINDTKYGSWALYYGSTSNDVTKNRLKELRGEYSKHGVNFDF